MQTLLNDISFALRRFRKNPGFALTAVLSLALGIGATVSVFSVIYDALLHPWPYAGADRISEVWAVGKSGLEWLPSLTGPQIRRLREAHAVEDVVGVGEENLSITRSSVPEDVQAVLFTGNGFQFFGLPALLGRYFVPSDAPDGKDPEPVAVLSYRFWRRHYNGDPALVGKTIQLNHKSYQVLGVMPARFNWWDGDVYLPQNMSQDQGNSYGAVLKLRPGISSSSAAAELFPIFQQFNREKRNYFPPDFKIDVRTITANYVRNLGGTLSLLFAAVALLLAIGCGNLSILLLAQGAARQHEFSIRAAVGASRLRLIRQLLTESLLLAITAAALGVLIAYQAIGLIVARLPAYSFPREADFHINLPMLLFSVCLAIVTGALFGLFPALQLARPKISQSMQSVTPRLAGSSRGKRLHAALIAGQIALTLLLLTGAGAAIQGFLRIMRVPLGYDPHHVMAVGVPIHENTLNTWAERTTYFEQLREKIAEMPGVLTAAISSNATPPASGFRLPFDILGKSTLDEQDVRTDFVSPEYFQALHIPLLQGRIWDHAETMRGATLALVNEAFVRRYFPNRDVLGHSVRIPQLISDPPYTLTAPGSDQWLQIVGVVGDSLDEGLEKPVAPALYLPYTLNIWMATQLLVRTQGEPLAMLPGVRQELATVNPDQQVIARVDNLEGWIRREPEFARARLVSILFAAFSGLALVLAAVGLYSVVSYSVAQRTVEFGVRMAMGAQRVDVLRIVVLSAAASVGTGLAAGIALSLGLNRLIGRWVENGIQDPFMVLGVSLLVIAVAALACVVPASRALSVNPMSALRHD